MKNSPSPAKRKQGRPLGSSSLDYTDTRIAYIRALKNPLYKRVISYARRQHIPVSTTYNRAIELGLAILEKKERASR